MQLQIRSHKCLQKLRNYYEVVIEIYFLCQRYLFMASPVASHSCTSRFHGIR